MSSANRRPETRQLVQSALYLAFTGYEAEGLSSAPFSDLVLSYFCRTNFTARFAKRWRGASAARYI